MNTPCVEFSGRITSGGYGQIKLPSGRYIQAHRLSYIKAHGPVPAGMSVCHACDNPACINLDHLFLGTPQINSTDMVTKGRSLAGERNPRAKLTADHVMSIRADYAAGHSARDVGQRHGISSDYVTRIVTGKVWKHLPLQPQKCGGWKITPEMAERIKALGRTGIKQRRIAEQFKISPATVCGILKGRRHSLREV